MNIFFTILAIIFLILSSIRIWTLLYSPRSEMEQEALQIAKRYGVNPTIRALKWPVVVFIICVFWLISLLFG